jgi:predicted transcriptional regulator
MTAITLNLPDDLAAQLLSQAASSKMSLEAFLQECVSDFALSDESALPPLHLTTDELDAVARAREDLAAGQTFTHEQVMLEMRQRHAR